jgi:hypothetical protein
VPPLPDVGSADGVHGEQISFRQTEKVGAVMLATLGDS